VLKRKAIEDPTVRPNKLIRRAIAESEVVGMNDISNFRRHIYRQRRKSQPVLPKSIEDAVQQLSVIQTEIQTFKLSLLSQFIIRTYHSKILLFTHVKIEI